MLQFKQKVSVPRYSFVILCLHNLDCTHIVDKSGSGMSNFVTKKTNRGGFFLSLDIIDMVTCY